MRRSKASTDRQETGAVAVEAALVTPLLFLLIFGLIDAALLMRDYAGATSATRVGVRIASTGADSGPCLAEASDVTKCPTGVGVPELAQQAADMMSTTSSAIPKDSVEYILVYKANEAGFPGTATERIDLAECLTECVAYRWSETQERFRWVQGSWDSSTISACGVPKPHRDNPELFWTLDSVGVQISVRHSFVAGALGTGIDVTDHAVMKFEPLANAFCAPGEHA
jgi:hypothetical protein